MVKTRRKYTEEFKREAVALSYGSGKKIKEVAADFRYSPQFAEQVACRGEPAR